MGAAGIMFLAAGAILYWVVEVDLPYVDDDALGGILMVAGIVTLTLAALMGTQRTPAGGAAGDGRVANDGVGSGVGVGLGMIAVGAIVYWAVNIDLPNVDDDALGVILMAAGAIAAAASMIMNAEHAQTSIGAGVGLIAVGAIVYWAVDIDLPYILDDALATILMVAGVAGVVAAVVTHHRASQATRTSERR